MANLRDGETVIDLGSGAGFDVFQAATKVGGSGKAVGVDMNDVIPKPLLRSMKRLFGWMAVVREGLAD